MVLTVIQLYGQPWMVLPWLNHTQKNMVGTMVLFWQGLPPIVKFEYAVLQYQQNLILIIGSRFGCRCSDC